MISVTVVGNLTRDFEQKAPNLPYRSAVAVNGALRAGNEYKTKFIDIDVWPPTDVRSGSRAYDTVRRLADRGFPLQKGAAVIVSGDLQFRTYVDDQGVEHERMTIVAHDIDLVRTGRGRTEASAEARPDQRPADAGAMFGSDVSDLI